MHLHRGSGIIVCALFVLASPSLTGAALIVGSMQEPFADYGATTFNNVTPPSTSQNGGQGWNATGTNDANSTGSPWGGLLNAGTARTVNAPGLTYSATSYLAPTGNKLTIDATSATQNIGRTLGGQTIDTGSTYFSVLMSRNTVDTIRTFNLAFEDGTTERFSVGQIGAAAGNTSGNIALLMNNSNPGGLVQAANPIAMGNSTTHLIVGRIDWNATGFETVSIWVDPTDVTTEAAAGTIYISTSAFELTKLTAIRPFAGNTAGGFNGVSANFDEIRLGGTWASVTSEAVAAPVPEPAMLGSIGISLGLSSITRRARKSS